MPTTTETIQALCPVCDAAVACPANVFLAEVVPCRACGTDLEVTGHDPLQLSEAPMEAEDWGE